MDIIPNFFVGSGQAKVEKPRPQYEMLQIAFANDPHLRRDFGLWLYERFDTLVAEYKTHGRFLSLQELHDSPLD